MYKNDSEFISIKLKCKKCGHVDNYLPTDIYFTTDDHTYYYSSSVRVTFICIKCLQLISLRGTKNHTEKFKKTFIEKHKFEAERHVILND